MKQFEYVKPATVSEASETLQRENAAALAGGTDLLGVLKGKLLPAYPDKVVNLKGIPGLDYIKTENGALKIGALTTLTEIARSSLVKEGFRAISDAAESVATPNIRNAATLGGNLCQDVRCWYYRYPGTIGDRVNCARKEGHLCSAMMGENRYHSIFGGAKVCETPCTHECPAGTDIPAYMARVREGDLDGAARIILKVNPMPAITSRVCAHFCMEGCNRGEYDESLNVGGVERYIGDYILDHPGDYMKAPEKENGKSVAIVGSGPSGLAAAYYLRQSGYQVTLYERMAEAGGCLTYAIPAYRLPKDIVRKFVSCLENMGIVFKLNTHVGEEGVSLEDLYQKNDSVMLDTGAWKRPLIGIAGEEMTRFGLDFLVDVNQYIHERPGAKVVVVGGGNVAVDVAITAKRLGSSKVSMVCLEPRDRMPAGAEEIQRVLEEGVELINGWGPKHIMKNDQGVSGIEFKSCPQVFDETGRFSPVYDEENTMSLDADVVLMAIGQVSDLDFLKGAYKVETERGRIKALAGNATSVPGIFAGGDVTTGPATVIKAIAAGKNTAVDINNYLKQEPLKVERATLELLQEGLLSFKEGCQQCNASAKQPELPAEERGLEKEDVGCLSEAAMKKETERCFNCGCLAVNPSDLSNVLVALDATIVTNFRSMTAEEFFTQNARIADTLKSGEVLLEVVIPRLKQGSVASYDKFRLRKSIDFAVLALATNYSIKDGVIEDARIVLGAAAPVPYRAKKAEQYLVGKKITEEVAEKAAALALADALALPHNEYKINIAKVMIRRSLVG